MKILLLVSGFNGLSQRVHRELSQMGHSVSVELAINNDIMLDAVNAYSPDLIICPFLKKRIPDEIWSKHICLVLHPGIQGDKGPSSLDWAISGAEENWGVTLLQANEVLDGGNVWASQNFVLRNARKSNVYRREVISHAVSVIKQAVINHSNNNPITNLASSDNKRGCYKPKMMQADRRINWQKDTTEDVVRKINAADGCPGVLDLLLDQPCYLYGAVQSKKLRGQAGEVLGQCNDWVCKGTKDGAVWIRMAKRADGPEEHRIKLPASQVLSDIAANSSSRVRIKKLSEEFSDITWRTENGVAYLYFDFYNGAVNTEHCKRLRAALKKLKNRKNKVIVLMGGEDFWCNGIQLNCIEANKNPGKEAAANLDAINDLIAEIIYSPKHITVAALRNNAGAGGAIMPLACDKVIARDGVVLNPHYGSMGLFGSEYWTYLLPRRVGTYNSQILMKNCLPLLASEAVEISMVDDLLSEDWINFHAELTTYAKQFTHPDLHKEILHEKSQNLKHDEKNKPLRVYRKIEQRIMNDCFMDPGSEFHKLRKAFVHKQRATETPANLAMHRLENHSAIFDIYQEAYAAACTNASA